MHRPIKPTNELYTIAKCESLKFEFGLVEFENEEESVGDEEGSRLLRGVGIRQRSTVEERVFSE